MKCSTSLSFAAFSKATLLGLAISLSIGSSVSTLEQTAFGQTANPPSVEALEEDAVEEEIVEEETIEETTSEETTSEETVEGSVEETTEPTQEDAAAETVEGGSSNDAGVEIEDEVSEENDAEVGEGEADAEDKTEPLSEADRIRRKLIIQADAAYEAGNIAEAQRLYQEAKNQTWLLPHQFATLPPTPFSDEADLSPGAAVYWREAKAGIENDRPSQAATALELLSTEYPEFTPGVAQHARFLQDRGEEEDAIAVIEQALTLYPSNTDLLLAQVDLLMEQEQWIEATIASRQFVALNSNHTAAPEQRQLAEDNLERFQSETREEIRNGAIANVFTGVLGYALTGGIYGPLTAASSAIMLLQGENSVGNQYAGQIQQQLPMLEHPEALGYVRNIGNQLVQSTGRRDLDYEFFVILDPNLNAFALPGGKIFVNAGAILDTRSEAELAGLLAHELSHSVLSHGFQIATRGNLTSSIAQYLPYGGLINNVFLSGYSRQMERQADVVGTQILASSGYAADGVYNVMRTLNKQAEASGRNVPTWISTHPNPADRVAYLQTLVERGGYNRYAYEGIARHEEIQTVVARELAAYEAQQAAENGEAGEVVDEAIEEREDRIEEQGDLYDAVERFNW